MQPCLSVIIPVFNEVATIEAAVNAVLAQPIVSQLIIVDDGSTDGTREILARLTQLSPKIKVLLHERNQGKGAAIRTGAKEVAGMYVIIQDADLEYDPREYANLAAPLLEGKADVVFGTRFAGGQAHRVLYYWHSVANKVLTTLSNMASNLNLTDMECCYKLFNSEVFRQINIEETGFGIEPELVAKVSKMNLRVYEVAVSYYGRTYEEGKKITWKDGVRALICILKYSLRK